MKHSLADRLLTGLAGLVLVTLGIGLFVYGVGIFPFSLDLSFFEGPFTFWQHVLMVLIAIVLFMLGIWGVSKIFRSGKEKGFILQRTEYGDLNISMSAMENMVKKCVDMNDELRVTQTKIIHTRDGVIVSIRILLENGVNIPMIVGALQKQTKQYITSCSGVDVKEVRVFVETSNNMGLKHKTDMPSEMAADVNAVEKAGRMVDRLNESVQKAIQSDAAPEMKQPEEKKESLHQRIFRKKDEEPETAIEMPPAAQPAEKAAEAPAQEPDAKPDKKSKKQSDAAAEPQDKEDA
ncbi:MAG TPA: alkaline shock response membrane anchor protein AmaP [Candidatus Limiplasma sp.]|nr:alkaline shock response membrane anchor protein AmaP [Candidatus Limiplasma sp.]